MAQKKPFSKNVRVLAGKLFYGIDWIAAGLFGAMEKKNCKNAHEETA